MKLDRSTGAGKYALIRLRKVEPESEAWFLLCRLHDLGVLDWSDEGGDEEFFAIKLKDRYAFPALVGYAQAAVLDDPEYAREVLEVAMRASRHPLKKNPD